MRNQRLQGRITAGRFTLPIVIFTCIACWVLTSVLLPGLEVKESSYPLWNIVNIPAWANRIVSFLLFAGIGYFLIELNNTFAIIRMRASVQTSLLLSAHHGLPRHAPALCGRRRCCNLSHFALFPVQAISSLCPAGYLFHSFALLSAGSVAFPQLTYFIPIWLMGASGFQSLTFRSFCGAIIGWSIPTGSYWDMPFFTTK